MAEFSHLDREGEARMVDVGEKAVVRRTERDHRTLLIVLVQPGVTRLEALHPFAPRLTDRAYVMVDHRVLTWE